jgi:hypothetical protein
MTDAAAALTLRPSERFDIGGVIARTFSTIGRNLPMFALLAAICVVVPGVLEGALTFKLNTELQTASGVANLANHGFQSSGLGLTSLGWALLIVVGTLYLQAAVCALVISQEQRTTAPNLLTTPWRHALPLLGILLLVGIATAVGLIFLIVPGVIVGMAFSVAAPVRVGEGLGVFASLQRSWALTRSFRWRIFLVFLLLVLVILAVEMAVVLIRVVGHISMAMWAVGIAPILSAVVNLVILTATALIYCELRKAKEGASASEVAAAFS